MHRLPIGILFLALTAASLAVTPVLAEENPWQSETFLRDYSGLKPSKAGREFIYVSQRADEGLIQFDRVMVDQPEISISPDSPYKSAKPDDLKAIAEFLRNAIVERLKARGYSVVEQSGDDVLYLRVALTHLQLKRKRWGVLSYTPVGAVVHGIKSAVQSVMKEVDIIDMAGQAEVQDSRTGEVLYAMVSRQEAPAAKPGDEKPRRMTFEEFKGHVDEHSDRLACRLQNARKPRDQRIDCTDPALRNFPLEPPPGQ